ncbi:hypothetical protein LSI01_05630 [Furfurilactobacillus siliginis]|uniref:YdhG-like domain-containing protein n=1 Tax=Furfurilactobacillus siliginis TaxID=348151 RepID=A0A510VMU7_9LACO|nr:hypothetical protein LSI01_05630 [Furfurilactobacillus siliginis]
MADVVTTYIESFDEPVRSRLEAVRALVHQLVPDVTEKIGYQMPAFVDQGRNLIYIGGFKDHLGVFPGVVDDQFAEYRTGKGTLQFKNNVPLPMDVIAQVVKAKHSALLKK